MRHPLQSALTTLIVACAFAATPALAQTTTTADLALTATTSSTPVDTSTAMAVKLSIKNNGPSNSTVVTVDTTAFPAEVEVASVSGCTPTDTAAKPKPLPCTVDDLGLGAGIIPESQTAKVTITFAITEAAATTISAGTTCPDPATGQGKTLGDVVVTAAATNDPTPNTQTVALPGIAPFADVTVDFGALDSAGKPQSQLQANEGDTVTFNGTVTNNGPCAAPNVILTTSSAMLEYVDGTGVCPNEKACKVGDLPVGGTATFARRYKVSPPPGASASSGAYAHTNEVDVSSNDITDANDVVTTPAAWDPNTDDNSARPVVVSNHTTSGCGTGGRGVDLAALAVLPALLLLARVQRRRAAAKS